MSKLVKEEQRSTVVAAREELDADIAELVDSQTWLVNKGDALNDIDNVY